MVIQNNNILCWLTWTQPSWLRLDTAAGSGGLCWRLGRRPRCPEHRCRPDRTWWHRDGSHVKHQVLPSWGGEKLQQHFCLKCSFVVVILVRPQLADSPLSYSEEPFWSEGSFCVDVHGFTFSTTLINGQLQTQSLELWSTINHIHSKKYALPQNTCYNLMFYILKMKFLSVFFC